MEYKFSEIEVKWKGVWEKNGLYKVTEDSSKPKFYVLDMFPYPSGSGLHVGHPLGYVASDIYARYKRMKGFNVLHPMGYDAFGIPAEQYAIETGTHPAVTTEKAVKRYREQLDKIGFSFDWSREVKTCDPSYYKWTQWIFLKLFNSWYNREKDKAEAIESLIEKFTVEGSQFTTEGKEKKWDELSESEQQKVLMGYRLAYISYAEVNWCAALGTVLANDEVKDGKSERGGHPVERKKMRQWFLRITEYSDRLLEGLENLDWTESMKDMQRNWIGRSEGALVNFHLSQTTINRDKKMAAKVPPSEGFRETLTVFTTRPDTIFGATFMVIAPEHDLVDVLTTKEQKTEIDEYITYVKSRSDVDRQQEKKVTGAFTGSYAINPFTEKPIPIYIAEYVLAGYGTGAIMAVPADDERDRKFAEKFDLPIIDVVDRSMYPNAKMEDKLGKLINSGILNGMEVKEAIQSIISEIERRGIGEKKVNYKQRDASFSRQRYWGEPFPIKYNIVGQTDPPFESEGESDDIPIALSENQLPLILPDVTSFKPTGDGRAPLANNADWVKNHYETDIMPGYAGSSWYFLRYMDPKNDQEFASKENIDYWQNVDVYFGGAEHAVGHLLYARMWHKFLYDLGYVKTDEPFKKLVNQGMIQGRSDFVYRMNYSYTETRLEGENTMGIDLPVIYVSKEYYDKNKSGTFDTLDTEKFNIAISEAKALSEKLGFSASGLKVNSNSISPINVEIELVAFGEKQERELILEEFVKHSRLGKNAILVLNDRGKYICGEDPEKMSKSKYNVINPDDVIEKHGADCFRMFEMFLGPIEQSKPWDDKGISGVSNFLKKFWRLYEPLIEGAGSPSPSEKGPEAEVAELKVLHKTLKKIADDIERLNFNTCISAFMIAANELSAMNCHKRDILELLLIALAPFAPFTTEELWERLGHKESIHLASYPKIEEKYLVEDSHTYGVSVNGKVRAEISLSLDITPQEAEHQVLALDAIKKWTNGNPPKKFIFVKGRIINVVV